MRGKTSLISAFAAMVLLAFAWFSTAEAEIQITFVNFGGTTRGLLYEPVTPGSRSHVGVVVMHTSSDFFTHVSCAELSSRGYRVLCANNRFTNNGDGYAGYYQHAPEIARAVNYLHNLPGIQKVALLGHSMGGPMMAFYQNMAENGPGVCQGPEKIIPCPTEGLTALPRADALMLMDTHGGDAFATLTYVDPAIVNENSPSHRNRRLDMFDPRNGYDPVTTGGTYSGEFLGRFFASQAGRNAELISQAQRRLARIERGRLSRR